MTSDNGETNFIGYLAAEEHNLLANMHNLRERMHWLHYLDRMWLFSLNKSKVSDKRSLMILMCFRDVHVRFYSAFASLFRQRLSEALSSTRRGIESAFHAYRAIEEPSYAELYIENKSKGKIRQNKRCIQEAREKDGTKYPLADDLLRYFGLFSSYGPHSEPGALALYHYPDHSDSDKIPFNLFQNYNDEEAEFWYYFLLVSFRNAYLILDEFALETKILHTPEHSELEKRLNAELDRFLKSERTLRFILKKMTESDDEGFTGSD